MSQYTLCKNLAQLYALLVEAVYIPYETLEHHLILKVCQQSAYGSRIYLITDNDAGRTAACKCLIEVVIFFTAGKCHNLSSYVRTQLLLAGASLNIHIHAALVVLITDELQRYNICSLMQELIE